MCYFHSCSSIHHIELIGRLFSTLIFSLYFFKHEKYRWRRRSRKRLLPSNEPKCPYQRTIDSYSWFHSPLLEIHTLSFTISQPPSLTQSLHIKFLAVAAHISCSIEFEIRLNFGFAGLVILISLPSSINFSSCDCGDFFLVLSFFPIFIHCSITTSNSPFSGDFFLTFFCLWQAVSFNWGHLSPTKK